MQRSNFFFNLYKRPSELSLTAERILNEGGVQALLQWKSSLTPEECAAIEAEAEQELRDTILSTIFHGGALPFSED